jgi:hypothetical protein
MTRVAKRLLSFRVVVRTGLDFLGARTMIARAVRSAVDARARRERKWFLACVERAAFLDGRGPLYITPRHGFRVKPAEIRPGSDEDFADRGGAVLDAVPPGQPPNPRWRRDKRPRHHHPRTGVSDFLTKVWNGEVDMDDRLPSRGAQ